MKLKLYLFIGIFGFLHGDLNSDANQTKKYTEEEQKALFAEFLKWTEEGKEELPPPAREEGVYWFSRPYQDTISFGIGINAVSVNLNGKVSILNSYSPIMITGKHLQKVRFETRRQIDDEKFYLEKYYLTLYSWAIGLNFSIDENQVPYWGFSLIPYQFEMSRSKTSGIIIGIGVQWLTRGEVIANRENFNIIIPISYSFDSH